MKNTMIVSFLLVFAFFTIGCANIQKTDVTQSKEVTTESKKTENEEKSSGRVPSYEDFYNPFLERL